MEIIQEFILLIQDYAHFSMPSIQNCERDIYFILFVGTKSLESALYAHSTAQFTPAAFSVSMWGYTDARETRSVLVGSEVQWGGINQGGTEQSSPGARGCECTWDPQMGPWEGVAVNPPIPRTTWAQERWGSTGSLVVLFSIALLSYNLLTTQLSCVQFSVCSMQFEVRRSVFFEYIHKTDSQT